MTSLLKKKALNNFVALATQNPSSFLLLSSTFSIKTQKSSTNLSHSSVLNLYKLFNIKSLKFPVVLKIFKDSGALYKSVKNDSFAVFLYFNNFYLLNMDKAFFCLNTPNLFFPVIKLINLIFCLKFFSLFKV
jgi:hypothetical protein